MLRFRTRLAAGAIAVAAVTMTVHGGTTTATAEDTLLEQIGSAFFAEGPVANPVARIAGSDLPKIDGTAFRIHPVSKASGSVSIDVRQEARIHTPPDTRYRWYEADGTWYEETGARVLPEGTFVQAVGYLMPMPTLVSKDLLFADMVRFTAIPHTRRIDTRSESGEVRFALVDYRLTYTQTSCTAGPDGGQTGRFEFRRGNDSISGESSHRHDVATGRHYFGGAVTTTTGQWTQLAGRAAILRTACDPADTGVARSIVADYEFDLAPR